MRVQSSSCCPPDTREEKQREGTFRWFVLAVRPPARSAGVRRAPENNDGGAESSQALERHSDPWGGLFRCKYHHETRALTMGKKQTEKRRTSFLFLFSFFYFSFGFRLALFAFL